MLTDAQLAERRGLLTSSIVPAVFSSDPYGGALSAQQLILGLLNERSELTPDKEDAYRRGNLCEAACLQYAAEELGAARWAKPPFVKHKNGWSGDSADALYYDKDDRLIAAGEAKTVAAGGVDKWGTPGTDEVPDNVLLQCCWHMLHHPVDLVAVPALFGGFRFAFSLYIVERRQSLIDRITNEAHAWYRAHIVEKQPVAPAGGDTEALRAMFPTDRIPSTEMTSDIEHWAKEKVLWEKARKSAEDKEETAKNHLRLLLGEHGAASSDTVSVTNRASKGSVKTDWKALAQSLGPDDATIDRFSRRVAGSRRLTVTVR